MKRGVGFLSEMTALPIHGGGITLQRILGGDLDRFDWFAETIRFEGQQSANYPGARSHSFPIGSFQRRLRPLLGSSWAHKISSHHLLRRCFARRVARGLLNCEQIDDSRVLVCPQSAITLWVVRNLSRHARFRYVTWMMDDHLVFWNKNEWRYPDGLEKVMGDHLRGAEKVFVISPTMQKFYQERFGVDSVVLCGPASVPTVPILERVEITSKPKLVYFGSLGRWQNDAVEMLVAPLKAGKVTLDLFSHNPKSVPVSLLKAGARVRGSIPPGQVTLESAHYDAVVLPISFKPELYNMSYFNIATKFSESLGMPIPTLLVGPSQAAMLDLARKAGACLVVDRPCQSLLDAKIQQLCLGRGIPEIVRLEHQLLQEKFTPEVMSERWASAQECLFKE